MLVAALRYMEHRFGGIEPIEYRAEEGGGKLACDTEEGLRVVQVRYGSNEDGCRAFDAIKVPDGMFDDMERFAVDVVMGRDFRMGEVFLDVIKLMDLGGGRALIRYHMNAEAREA